MPLVVGTRLGPYEIVAPIGAGGMGEVYRARDTKLKRDVAIKVLPEAFSQDADRLARFQREAELLATLNHSGIAAVYGLEDSGGITAIVLEFVNGDTLSDRIGRGVPALDEALQMAREIADALEAAHDKGVVHRDLKPSNIKITSDGKIKLLDFGLAKMLDAGSPEGPTSRATLSPTLSVHATYAGVILGTAAYMSPEQARGKPVDKRADIWSFGCVLFEMLTGARAFDGDEVSDTLAFVITREPAWTALPASTPSSIRRLLRRCLEKDRTRRLADIADARIEIDEASREPDSPVVTSPLVPAPSRRREYLWAAAALFFLMTTAVLALRTLFTPAPESPTVRFDISPPEGARFGGPGAHQISPDGRTLAFVAISDSKPSHWVRPLDSPTARSLPGTEDAQRPFDLSAAEARRGASGSTTSPPTAAS